MRVMVLVAQVPKALNSEVPWHFFQELRPLAARGVELCVVSGVRPEYSFDGVEFFCLEMPPPCRRLWGSRHLARLLLLHWGAVRRGLGRGNVPFRRMLRCLEWNARLLPIVRNWRPDVMHSHWAFPANSGGAFAAAALGVPLVMTLRGIEHQVVPEFGYGNCLLPENEWALTEGLRLSSRITVCCSDSLRRLDELGIDYTQKAVRVYHAVDAMRLHAGTATAAELQDRYGLTGKTVITCVALMDSGERKGHGTLLHAFQEVLPGHPNAHLLLVGGGPDENRLRRVAADLGIAGSVTFAGRVHPNDVGRILEMSALSVLPSHSEAFANVVFESLVMGTPVVSGAVGTPRDVLTPFGGLFRPGDTHGLTDAICWALDHLDEARDRARRGGDLVIQEMSLARRVDTFVGIYRSLTKCTGAARGV